MKKLLSLPPHLTGDFHHITGLPEDEWFCTHDPVDHKLGSGGGTAWLMRQCHEKWGGEQPFDEWMACDRRIILHAGGQGRRLPAYAPVGKILTPIPVFRWERGQKLSQNLLQLQMPLYEKMMAKAPASLTTMIVSGDVLIRTTQPLPQVPEADVVCFGLWLDVEVAKNHGVFVINKKTPTVLERMVQKPSTTEMGELMKDHLVLTDIGVWMLSDKAMRLLVDRSTKNGEIVEYDLYSQFGCSLGTHPGIDDSELKDLRVCVLPLPGGQFYHFGTSRELISSMVSIQNLEIDQRNIMHLKVKPSPSIFIQNAECKWKPTEANTEIWVENSCIGAKWHLTQKNIVTGVPRNDWCVSLHPEDCVDFVPVCERGWCVRVYGFYDRFDGDAQREQRFPVAHSVEEAGAYLALMLADTSRRLPQDMASSVERLSAEDISNVAHLGRLEHQRVEYRCANFRMLADNWQHSVFYQLDLDDASECFSKYHIPMPGPLGEDAPLMHRFHNAMFRGDSDTAFELLAQGLIGTIRNESMNPHLSVYPDQIVWGRSPVRIDVAGGWTDTPPYCLYEGGNVVNMAVKLNGQQPLQTFVKLCKEPKVMLRSIDQSAVECVETYQQLSDFNIVGSPFSIPKAALVLSGFHPDYSAVRYPSLRQQLEEFGGGIEITTLSAVPAGSGLGTSSILAATILATLSDFCGLAWDKDEVGKRILVLEQLLTTGGGWQDQFGGVMQGVKLLQTTKGFMQSPVVRWLPNYIFTQPEYSGCHLLYYTGITRTAKQILSEIVRRMFLNNHDQLALLRDMKQTALDMYEAIQKNRFEEMGRLLRLNWSQNQLLDAGTNPPEVKALTERIDDLALGYKLPGAGGGGFLYIVAKDQEAAARIVHILNSNANRPNARFVDLTLCSNGLQITRS